MPFLVRLVLAAVAGAVLALGFEPFALGFLLPVPVAGLSLLLAGLSAVRGFAVGTVFGSAFMIVLLPWLQVIGADAWIALSVLEGLFYGALGSAVVLVQRLSWWPLWGAALWVGMETLRGAVPFGGFPWGRLAFATVDTPLAALLAYVGAPGTSFVVALLGCALAWAVLTARRTPVRATGVLVAAGVLGAAGAVLPGVSPSADARTVRVAAVQGDVPGEGMDAFAERRAVLDNHVAATHGLAADVAGGAPAPDLVIWPENSTDIDPFADPTVHADIQGAVDAVGVPVLVGAMVSGDHQPGDVFNQGIVWGPGTGPGERYSKMHPVPFGEYIPMRDLFSRWFTRLEQIPRDMVPGTEPGVLDMAGTTIGDVICFEVAYDGLVRAVVEGGAALLVVQTNNATYMGTGEIEQQFAISRLRAIETGRYVVVAATNGVSGVIRPDGEVVDRAPVRTREVLVNDLPVLEGLTPAMRWGRGIELLLLLVGAVPLSCAVVVGHRRRRAGGRDEQGLGAGRR